MNSIQSLPLLVVAVCVASFNAAADDPVFSGPQSGEKLASLPVVSVYGERAGETVDLTEAAAGKPTLLVFVHQLTRPGVALTRSITGYAQSQERHGVFSAIIWLDDDRAKAEEYLNRAKKSLNFAVPVGVSVDGGEGPGAYGLNRNVELTILIAEHNQVVGNFALVQPSVTEAADIAGVLAKLIQQPMPTAKQMESLAYPGGGMMARRGAATRAGAKLRELMKGVIAADVSDASLKESAKAVEDWVGDDRQRQSQLAKMAAAVLERGLGTETAQAQVKKWLEQDGENTE